MLQSAKGYTAVSEGLHCSQQRVTDLIEEWTAQLLGYGMHIVNVKSSDIKESFVTRLVHSLVAVSSRLLVFSDVKCIHNDVLFDEQYVNTPSKSATCYIEIINCIIKPFS
ncbi:hypothetical protein DPMN_146424 [Dreissena polymorpha]|uniref:Uncharacterized protein n=1 Tax=Dreissena polymorpha TaxID=45954 RepID=A0A9D4F6K0_DREPO|nr:hypothetical protein DPMN_146424 [Dreissena polymorpha]